MYICINDLATDDYINVSYRAMKIKLSKEQIEQIVADPKKAEEAKIKVTDPWWVVVLKVLKYVIELVLAGAGGYLAVSCASAIM